MDYPIFVKDIGAVDVTVVDQLLNSAMAQTFIQHPGFNQPVKMIADNLDKQALHAVIEQLAEWFPTKTYHRYEVVCLDPGQAVKEHSDICGAHNNRLWMAAHYHKIHLPLSTNPGCYSEHRRSIHDPISKSYMQKGHLYLYNDYVWHTGVNNGDTSRLHLCLAYYDPKWQYPLKAWNEQDLNSQH